MLMMKNLEDFALALATEWFRTLERHLASLHELETHTRLSMLSLEEEARTTFPRASLTFHVRVRGRDSLPEAIDFVRLSGRPDRLEELGLVTAQPKKRWYQRLKGPPSRAEMFRYVKDVGLLDLYNQFYSRAQCLNDARNVLALGRSSIEKRAGDRAVPRPWEAGDLSAPAPLLETSGLPETSVRALGAAWRVLLRMAAVRFELIALARRHNASPPRKGLRLAFRVDAEHTYGRFLWTDNGINLSCQARGMAKGRHRKRVDPASLPDRLMRRLGIPTVERKAIRPHERHRRRMFALYEDYVDIVHRLLSTAPKRLKKAEGLLRQAGYPGSLVTPPCSDSVLLSN